MSSILYVGNFRLPDGGASANRVVSNAKIFASLEREVVFLGVTDDRFEGIRKADFSSGAFNFKAFEESYPSSNAQWLRHMVSVKNIKKAAAECSNLELIILYNAPFTLLKAVKAAFKGIRVVYDCTEWNPFADGNVIKRKIKAFDERLIRTKAGIIADDLIVISSLMREHYKNDCLLLPPLVDTNDSIWHSEHIQHDGFEFLFAGDINGSKERLDLIVKAFGNSETASEINDNKAFLTVIGVTEDEFSKRYPEITINCGAVRFLGRLSHEETVQRVCSCDCYIFIREADRRNSAGFPTKFAEAYTAGVPIITTDVSDVAEYMTPDKGIVLDKVDLNSVCNAVKTVLSSTYHKRGIDTVFFYEKYIKKTNGLFFN